jgi:hypothetical protein
MLDAQHTSEQDAVAGRIRCISLDGEHEVAFVEIPGQPERLTVIEQDDRSMQQRLL